jgi:hypothetical protein
LFLGRGDFEDPQNTCHGNRRGRTDELHNRFWQTLVGLVISRQPLSYFQRLPGNKPGGILAKKFSDSCPLKKGAGTTRYHLKLSRFFKRSASQSPFSTV